MSFKFGSPYSSCVVFISDTNISGSSFLFSSPYFKFVTFDRKKRLCVVFHAFTRFNNINIYLLQLGRYPVAVVILHVNKTLNRLLLNLSLEGYMRSM